jgi:centrosomal protein CEP290
MTAAAEERIISITSQKEANLNVQQVVDRHTRELKVNIDMCISLIKFSVPFVLSSTSVLVFSTSLNTDFDNK